MTGPATGTVGVAASYTVQVSGAGATGVYVTTVFTPAVTFNSGAGCTANTAAGDPSTTVTCSWTGSNITMQVTPRSAGTLHVVAGAIGSQSDPTMSNNSASTTTSVASSDFNADGNTDLVWRNYSTGANTVWYMNGTTYTGSGSLAAVTDPNWYLVGAADFNGDGKTDLLWRNQSTGANTI